jgi:hypothetical protein
MIGFDLGILVSSFSVADVGVCLELRFGILGKNCLELVFQLAQF